MTERNHRVVRIGIDIGGTYTRCAATDNETREIIGKNQVKTAHDGKSGVVAGIVKSFRNCVCKNSIAPGDVVFVARSVTRVINAFIKGDVAGAGVVGVVGGDLEGSPIKCQLTLKGIILSEEVGKMIRVYNTFIKEKMLTEDVINQNIDELLNQGSQVIAAFMAFGMDNMDEEMMTHGYAEKKNVPVTMTPDITKLYGLMRRTHTAAISASILSEMMTAANAIELSVRAAGITVPLTIVRGDGGVMEISEMCKHPILTALSRLAVPVMGSLMYLCASNVIYSEVGGVTANIDVIKSGHPGVNCAQIGGHGTYISSLDVRTLGCAGSSMVYISDKTMVNVGSRSAHTAGCEHAYFTSEEETEDPQIEMVGPKPRDPNDYVTIQLENRKHICFINTCAANMLGPIKEQYFTRDNANTARKAMQPVVGELDITVERSVTQILDKDFEKVNACINVLAEKYQLDRESMKLVDCGDGAVSLVPCCAGKMRLRYSIPENAEVISSIGVTLSMVCDIVECVIPSPSQDDIRELKKEAADMTVSPGAPPDTVEVHIKIDNQTGKVTTIATGFMEVKATDLLEECDEAEAYGLATQDFGSKISQITLAEMTNKFYMYQGLRDDRHPLRVVDKRGSIRAQRSNGSVMKCKIADYRKVVKQMWRDEAVFKTDTVMKPDFFVCMRPRVDDYSVVSLDQIYLSMDLDLGDRKLDEDILTVASVTEI